jgi:isoleucyl-tRNA synthetase
MRGKYVSSVNTKVDFPQMEENVLTFWQAEDIFKKSIESRSQENEYVFYDGPPFATVFPISATWFRNHQGCNPKVSHHERQARTSRFRVDCHGLPVSMMEKSLGISGHSAIVSMVWPNSRAVPLDCPAIPRKWQNTINRMGAGRLGPWVSHHGYQLYGINLVGFQDPL